MVSRRGVLKTAGAVALGGAGVFAYLETDLFDDAERAVVGPPPTETQVHSVSLSESTAAIRRVELYESGAAVVTFGDDLRCFERFGVAHDSADIPHGSYRRWDTVEGGSTTIALRSVLQANGPHPSRRFRVEVLNEYYTDNDGVACVEGPGPKALTFTVPEGWLGSK